MAYFSENLFWYEVVSERDLSTQQVYRPVVEDIPFPEEVNEESVRALAVFLANCCQEIEFELNVPIRVSK